MRLDGCGRGRCHSGGFLLRIMPPSWHPVPACTPDFAAGGPFFFAAEKIRIGRGSRCCHGYCRRNHSLLPQGKLESDAEDLCRYASCRRAILLCCYENWKRTQNAVETTNSAGETLHRFPSLSLKSRITARKRA